MLRLFFTVFLFVDFSFSKELVNKIVATINDEIVLQSELDSLPSRLKKEGGVDETLFLNEKPSLFKESRKAQLSLLIRERLIDSEVKRLGLSVTQERVDEEYVSLAKRGGMSTSDFASFLAKKGYSVKQYKELLKARTERQAFFEKEIIAKLRITDEDAYSVYQKDHPEKQTTVSEFKISQIFFSTKKTTDLDGAFSRATAAYGRILAGESFESVANQLDETPNANRDGFLGEFKAGEFVPEIERALSQVGVGDITKIIRSSGGYHIVKVLSKKTVPDPDFLRVKERIKGALVQQNFERQLKNWFELKKLDATIKIFDVGLQ